MSDKTTVVPITSRAFVRNTTAIPTPHPDGGVFHVLPMSQRELNRLAKNMVSIEYLQDKRGKTIFNPEGEPIPRMAKSDEAILAEAMRKVRKITAIAVEVSIDDELQYEEDGVTVRRVDVELDASEVECGSDHATLEGRCAVMVGRKGEPPIRCAHVKVGDFVDLAAKMMLSILEGPYITEVEVGIDGAPAADAAATTDDQQDLLEGTSAAPTEPPPPAKPKKRKVWQLVAEWVLDKSSDYGRAKQETEIKN